MQAFAKYTELRERWYDFQEYRDEQERLRRIPKKNSFEDLPQDDMGKLLLYKVDRALARKYFEIFKEVRSPKEGIIRIDSFCHFFSIYDNMDSSSEFMLQAICTIYINCSIAFYEDWVRYIETCFKSF